MANIRIEIDADTHGHVGWQLHAVREPNSNNDTETNSVNSVISTLNEFVKKLENNNLQNQQDSNPENVTWSDVICNGEPSALAKVFMKNQRS